MTGLPAATAHDGSARQVAVAGVRFLLHRADPPRRRRTTPVLLLHGVPETALMWRHLLPELARDRTVLAPDLKGLGGSEIVGRFDVRTLADELAALVLHEVAGPVDVVGHDWGGALGLALAGARPELVRRLVVVNAPYRRVDPLHAAHLPFFALPLLPELLLALGRGALIRSAIGYCWRAERPLDQSVLAEYVRSYTDPARVTAMLGYYRAVVRGRLVGSVRRWVGGWPDPATGPARVQRCLVLWGAADPVLPVSVGAAAVRDLGPGTEFVTLPGVGHFPLEEAPEISVPLVAGFLRG